MAAALGILLFSLAPISRAQSVSVSCSVSGRGSYPIFYKDDVVTCYVQGPASSAVQLNGGYQGDTDSGGNFTSSAMTMSQAGGPSTWTWSVGGINAPQMTYWVVLDTPSLCQISWDPDDGLNLASTDVWWWGGWFVGTDPSGAGELSITAEGGSGLAQQCSSVQSYVTYNYQYPPFLILLYPPNPTFVIRDTGPFGSCDPPRPSQCLYQSFYPMFDAMYINAYVWDYINETLVGSTGPLAVLWVGLELWY